MQQRIYAAAGEFGAAIQEIQLEHEAQADYIATEPLYQLRDRFGRASGSEHVVDDQDFLSRLDRILMYFEDVGSVFELVLNALGDRRQFFGFTDGHEACIERVGDGGSEDETAGFDPHNDFDSLPFIRGPQIVDHRAETRGVFQQRGDVVKIDAGLGEIRHFSDKRF